MLVKNRFTENEIGEFNIEPGADLSDADLRFADLSRANLFRANLFGANLSDANLRGADLSGADLRGADLRGAKLSGANLRVAKLSGAKLSGADLSGADLSGAKLSGANLSDANLSDAKLSGANLSDANLSDADGLINPAEWLSKFESDDLGVIVYKRIGNTDYPAPERWTIEPGMFLTETVNPDRCTVCACGVNFGTWEFCQGYGGEQLWKCRIRWIDLAGVVVPYNTDGKARCGRLELIERIV